jgi:hypothetical protein
MPETNWLEEESGGLERGKEGRPIVKSNYRDMHISLCPVKDLDKVNRDVALNRNIRRNDAG